MILQTTETSVRAFDVKRLTPADENAVQLLTGGHGLPGTAGLRALLQQGDVIGDYGAGPGLQAVCALLPLWSDAPLAMAMRAAGFAADGQGAVLTRPQLAWGYSEVRRFLAVALAWAQERYTSYHVWAVLPAGEEELCAQYLAAGLSLRGARRMDTAGQTLVFAARGLPRWEEPVKRVHFQDRRLPRLLEQGYGAADFGWDKQGMVLMLRPVGF